MSTHPEIRTASVDSDTGRLVADAHLSNPRVAGDPHQSHEEGRWTPITEVVDPMALGGRMPMDEDGATSPPAEHAIYRTSCLAGHLAVHDGIDAQGVRLWHCERDGCGAGRFVRPTASGRERVPSSRAHAC